MFFLFAFLMLSIIAYNQQVNADKLKLFFLKTLSYPQESIDSFQKGFVLVKFDIDSKTGKTTDITTLFSQFERLSNEVVRVVRLSDGIWKEIVTGNQKTYTVILPFYFDIDIEGAAKSRNEECSYKPVVNKSHKLSHNNVLFLETLFFKSQVIVCRSPEKSTTK